ncbi:MAG: patatin-like phospholipase family protein, partial [Steroidobacteraceae bacterium]
AAGSINIANMVSCIAVRSLFMGQACHSRAAARRPGRFIGLCLLLVMTAGCTTPSAFLGEPITQVEASRGYRLGSALETQPSPDMLVVVTLSGGGKRASAMAYGLLEQLATDRLRHDGLERRLLDEVDIISAVSGGAIPAAYYTLYGDRLFADFERGFLNRNVAAGLRRRIFFDPRNWFRLASSEFSRGDIYAEYFDQKLFRGATYADLRTAGPRPFLILNATDVGNAGRFDFTQDSFDVLCMNLDSYPVSRAVAASSSVPALFTPITLHNEGGRCGHRLPAWVGEAVEESDHASRRHFRASILASRADSPRFPYLHLVDGALSDNLGVRAPLDALTDEDDPSGLQRLLARGAIHTVVFITLNASDSQAERIAASRQPPALFDMLRLMGTVPVDRYSVESKVLLQQTLEAWSERLDGSAGSNGLYFIDLELDALQGDPRYGRLTRLKTSLSDPPRDIAELRCAAKLLLSQAAEYQRLIKEKGGQHSLPPSCATAP